MNRKYVLPALFIFSILVAYLLFNKISNKTISEEEKNVNKLRVQLQWFNGAQFCGMYVAKYNGYYQKEGLDVELIEGGFRTIPFDVVFTGKADIGMATGDQVLINKELQNNIKAIGTVFNTSLACFMAKEGRVKTVADFEGKKIGVYRNFDTENILKSIIKKQNLDSSKIIIKDAGLVDAFINDEIDLFPSYVINEPIDMNIKVPPIKVTLFKPSDLGVTFYSDTYFTTKDFHKKNKDELKRFLKATAQGWDFCKKNPEQAINIMFTMLKNKDKKEAYNKELMALKEAIKYLGDGEKKSILYMRREKWEEMEKQLNMIGKIKKTGYISDLCDFELID